MNVGHIFELAVTVALAIALLMLASSGVLVMVRAVLMVAEFLAQRKHRRRMERARSESRRQYRPERKDGRPRKHFALMKPTFATRCRLWEVDDHIVVLGDEYAKDQPWTKMVPCELCWKLPDMGPPRRLTADEKEILEKAIKGS